MQVHVPKCWNVTACMKSKRKCIFVLSVKPRNVLKVLKQYESPTTCAPKNDLFLSPLSLD